MPRPNELDQASMPGRLSETQQAGIAALVELSAWSEPAAHGPSTADLLDFSAIARPALAVRLRGVLARRSIVLTLIMVVQTALSLRLIWTNSAYEDEALYLWAGRLELAHLLHGTPVPAFQTYFSGSPIVYPPLAALANDIGGLAAARILSLAFMLGATWLLYCTASRLLGRDPALAAAAFFATFGLGVELGAFATYDAMAIFLTALAAYLVVRSAKAGHGEAALILAGLVLGLADATKYAAALWDPVVICLALLISVRGSKLSQVWRAVRLACYTAIPAVIALKLGGSAYLQGIKFTTLSRQIITNTAPLKILDIAWGWLALLLLLGILGVVMLWHDRRRFQWLPVVLYVAALLAPVAQARIHDITSLHKQVVFGAWFLCIVVGYAISSIARLDGKFSQGAIIGGILLAVSAGTGYAQASSIYASWPSMAPAMPALGRAIRQAQCPCLISQESAADYYLPAADLTGPIIGPYTFTYRDAAISGVQSGQTAMASAIMNGYFGAVEIDGTRTPAMYRLLQRSLIRSHQYQLIYRRNWSFDPDHPTEVWERTARVAP